MSLLRYFSQNHDDSGENLSWARAEIEGAPFRSEGPAPLMKESEFDARTYTVRDAKVKVFDLGEPTQLAEYQLVLERVAAGWYHIWRDEPKFIESSQNWKVLCVWLETYQEQKPTI